MHRRVLKNLPQRKILIAATLKAPLPSGRILHAIANILVEPAKSVIESSDIIQVIELDAIIAGLNHQPLTIAKTVYN